MKIGSYLTGSFGQSQNLYHARNELERGRGGEEQVRGQLIKDTKKVISLQKNAGLDYIIDPMFKFFYLFQPFVENFPGIEIGSQENWFDNNVFYRVPKISKLLTKKTGFTENYFYLDLLPNGKSIAVLPSPYTLFSLSDLSNYNQNKEYKWDIVKNLSHILKAEAEYLVEKGIKRIQYDEPAIVVKNSLKSIKGEDIELLNSAFKICGKINGATTSLNTYFGSTDNIIPYLKELNVDCIGIDCIETNINNILKHCFKGKELALGLLDSRNPAIENKKDLVEIIKETSKYCNPDYLWITPNTATEYIGYTSAVKKLEILGEVLENFK